MNKTDGSGAQSDALVLSGAQAETGVMPGTANRSIDEELFVQRGIIVRADVTDGEQFVAPSR